jgi:hypothetical protein
MLAWGVHVWVGGEVSCTRLLHGCHNGLPPGAGMGATASTYFLATRALQLLHGKHVHCSGATPAGSAGRQFLGRPRIVRCLAGRSRCQRQRTASKPTWRSQISPTTRCACPCASCTSQGARSFLYTCPSIRRSACLSFDLSVCLSACLSVCLPACLPVSQPAFGPWPLPVENCHRGHASGAGGRGHVPSQPGLDTRPRLL